MDQTRVKLSVTALGILAVVLGYFGYVELLFLLIAYAVFLDKSQPLAKMSFQALYLRLGYRVVLLVLGWVFDFFRWFFRLIEAYKALDRTNSFWGYINTILSVLLFAAYLFAAIQIISKKSCNLPFLGMLADKTLGLVTPKAKPAPGPSAGAPGQGYQPPQGYQAPPQQQPPRGYQAPPQQPPQGYQAPQQPPVSNVPVQPPIQTPVNNQPDSKPEPVETEAQKNISDKWKCNCGHENTGNFCMKCGSPRS